MTRSAGTDQGPDRRRQVKISPLGYSLPGDGTYQRALSGLPSPVHVYDPRIGEGVRDRRGGVPRQEIRAGHDRRLPGDVRFATSRLSICEGLVFDMRPAPDRQARSVAIQPGQGRWARRRFPDSGRCLLKGSGGRPGGWHWVGPRRRPGRSASRRHRRSAPQCR
jgi:hypothetical protein